jgi:dTMP kinase
MSFCIVNKDKAKVFELVYGEEELMREKLNLMISRSGKLIVFEGIDGAGKTTVHKALKEKMKGRGDIVFSGEPTDSEYGRKVREVLGNGNISAEELLFLFMQDRIEHVKNVIIPSLKEGKVVVLDRYYLSTVAYQASRLFPLRELLFLNSLFSPAPDLVVYFEISVREALERLKGRGAGLSVFEEEEKLREVAGNYERVLEYFDVVRVDALLPIEELVDEVEKIVVEFVSRR